MTSRVSRSGGARLAAGLVVAASWLAMTTAGAVGCSSTQGTAPPDAGPLPDGGPTDASGPIAATMNDVSVLFPLPSSAADVANLLPPSASGAQGVLLPSALYESIGPISGSSPATGEGGFQPIAAYTDLRVVAVRVDPCFASLAPDPHGVGCTAQIRLVFQEVRWDSTSNVARVFDSALHVFYDLGRDQFLALARALVDLRVANTDGDVLGPLGPHPILVRQGLAGPMSQGVERLVLQYAGEQSLVRTAQLSALLNELGGSWTMSAFDVGQPKTVGTPRAIPTLDGDGGVFVETVNGTLPPDPDGGPPILAARFDPATTSADDFGALDDGDAGTLPASDRQAAFDGLVRVENPKDNSPETIHCASCHLATPTEKLVALPRFSLDDTTSPLAFQPDGTFVTPGDMAATFDTTNPQFNLHAFSYFGVSPGISQRVVNETAAVVAYLNDLPQ